MMRLETLIELTFLNSSFSSSNLSIRAFRAFRACPLVEIRQTAPCRAIRSKSSDSRQQYLSQQYPPPLLLVGLVFSLQAQRGAGCVERRSWAPWPLSCQNDLGAPSPRALRGRCCRWFLCAALRRPRNLAHRRSLRCPDGLGSLSHPLHEEFTRLAGD